MRIQPASLQIGRLTSAGSIEMAAVSVLIGIESVRITSPIFLMTCCLAGVVAAAGDRPVFKNAGDVAPVSSIVGDCFGNCLLDPGSGVSLQRADDPFREQRSKQTDVLLVETKDIGTFRLHDRRRVTVPQLVQRRCGAGRHLLESGLVFDRIDIVPGARLVTRARGEPEQGAPAGGERKPLARCAQ